MTYEEIWKQLPNTADITMTFGEHSDQDSDYPEVQTMAPYNIRRSETEFLWDNIRFTSRKEFFGAPRNPHLFVYRQTIEAFSNCEFDLKNAISNFSSETIWKIEEYLEHENNTCGLLLSAPDGRKLALCETSQILAFSFHVDEKREKITRSYHITAFEESPIKLEKYIAIYTDEEADYIEKAMRECRSASMTRFDDLKGIGAW